MWFSKKKSREEQILDTLREMSTQFANAMQHQADNHLESIRTIAAANIEVSKGLGEQAKSFSNWIDSFKVAAQPEARVMDDVAMVALQNDRLRKSGFPVDADQKTQLDAVVKNMIDFENLEAQLFG
jgi:hypothetical protein